MCIEFFLVGFLQQLQTSGDSEPQFDDNEWNFGD